MWESWLSLTVGWQFYSAETERDRAISTQFLTHRVAAESTGDFFINGFPATFGGHLEFLR